MKRAKKSMSLVLALSMVFLLAACSNNARESSDNKTIYEHGIELISLMEEMAESETYFALYSGSPELQEIVSVVGSGDYAEPKAVYKIKIADDMLSGMAEVESAGGLSDTLKEYVVSRAQAAVVSQINAAGGANMLAAASICTAGKTFVSDELTENAIYLYTYENAVPAIVTFTTGENGAVSASGSFIFYEDFKTDTAGDIEQFFAEIGAEVEEID